MLTGAAPRPGLDTQARRRGRFYGAAIDDHILATDPAYMAHVAIECGMLTGETAFKWGEIRPTADAWNWAPADALLAFAAQHHMAVRGHTLLWHEHNPDWLQAELTPQTAERLLRRHIQGMVGHCRRRVVQWDVVNEVLNPQDDEPGGWRKSLWYQALGPRLLDVAFHACAEADPHALRCINEYGFEYTWDTQEQRREAMLALLQSALARGVPVQALGMQAHLEAGAPLDQARLAQFCHDVVSLGLKLVITELDVRDNALPSDPALRDAGVASHARAYLDAVLDGPAVLGVVTWGLSDRRTWLNDAFPRADGLPQRPLPLDAALERKPLWGVLATELGCAPSLAPLLR